ncbi:uncharacterized protein [Watersipora subatra]|uniref:uncharacterized protein n=1 Tax=Watersipora subatra TaxID=2589382 RepID=UPI00355C6587
MLAIEREFRAMDGIGVSGIELRYDNLEEELDKYLRDLMCFGFQSKSFDIPLMKKHIIRYLLETRTEIDIVIKKANKYMMIQTKKLRFLDIANFLPEGISLSDYLKAMEVDSGKFHWIYERFTSMEVLKRTDFPKKEEFYSELKRKHISDEEYELCKNVWTKEKMTTLRDLLIYYNEADVTPLVTAIERQNEFFKSRNLDFKSAISIPGLSIRYLFQLKDPEAPIFMFGNRFSDLYHLLRRNIRGGLSLVFNRYQERGKTKIKSEYFAGRGKRTLACMGWDCTSMYLHNLALCDMPTGAFVRRRRGTNFKIEKSHTTGEKATEWIEWMSKQLNIRLQHQFNGTEKRIGGLNIPVDGYGVSEKGEEIVLNYSGCWYHSHMCQRAPVGIQKNKRKDKENRSKVYKHLKYFVDLGYTVYHVWECTFDRMKVENPEIAKFCKELRISVDSRYRLTEEQILKEIENGEMFGIAEVDICVPDRYKEIFSEFQPITKHAFLSRDDIGDHMREFAEKHNLLKRPMKTLLNSYFAKKILLATPLLRWYLNHNIKCTKVYQVIQYKPSKCFTRFGQEVMEARREGDVDPTKKIISDNCKLIGNSAYGRTLTNIETHTDVSFHEADDITAGRLINNQQFRDLQQIDEDKIIEVEKAKRVVRLNIPVQIGFFVLEYGKLHLLRFYYDFLLKFISFEDFCLIQCDTDSLYMSLSEDTFYLAVIKSKRGEFIDECENWLSREYCHDHKDDFFKAVFAGQCWQSQQCCTQAAKYYLRQAGLFHLENVSEGIIALCSKSYYCFGKQPKYSSKGISKRHTELKKEDYMDVLLARKIGMGTNKGIRSKNNSMFTYTQHRKGLNYMYGKRVVCADDVTTLPTKL